MIWLEVYYVARQQGNKRATLLGIAHLYERFFLIGRSGGNELCHLVLHSQDVSRVHCHLIKTYKSGFLQEDYQLVDGDFLRDVRSRNGTLVNNKPCRIKELEDRDKITIGKHYRLIYRKQDSLRRSWKTTQ